MAHELYRVTVSSRQKILPDTTRLTLRGDFSRLDTGGPLGLRDMRIKVLIGGTRRDELIPADLMDPCAYRAWLAHDESERGALRTYTVASRLTGETTGNDLSTIDIDVVTGDHHGPGSTWARTAEPGDDVLVFLSTRADSDAELSDEELSEDYTIPGIEYAPEQAHRVVLVGDTTALPAIRAIGWAEATSAHPRTVSAIIAAPMGTAESEGQLEGIASVTWVTPSELVASSVAHVWRVYEEVLRESGSLCADTCNAACELDDDAPVTSLSDGVLWDTPAQRRLLAQSITNAQQTQSIPCTLHPGEDCDCQRNLFVWVAGESSKVVAIRRALVSQIGMKRRDVAFMGYWR
ncbi:siderophore-interacting protein [Actinomyces vulturis]|uniref:siderophore-interacting protein n=1 Tax=Actinomyces vulturis TaxID=1857645 RepID=UPI00082B3FA7|nr:siderophore-interacting protein [Actinomyces vulturis]